MSLKGKLLRRQKINQYLFNLKLWMNSEDFPSSDFIGQGSSYYLVAEEEYSIFTWLARNLTSFNVNIFIVYSTLDTFKL